MSKEVVIVAATRTPIGSFLGDLSTINAPTLGSIAIKGALEKVAIPPDCIDEVFIGHVVQAGTGQAPARQAALLAGISPNTPCTTVNKVCASAMKAVMLAAQSIAIGDNDIVIAAGMESMSNIPHLTQLRKGTTFGNNTLVDAMQKDGLTDPFDNKAMGVHADACATHYNISREEQDAYALTSYKRAQDAWEQGKFTEEVTPVSYTDRKKGKITITTDEEFTRVKPEKIPELKPVFTPNGSVTAANASTINDGAGAMLLMSKEKANALGLTIMAHIKSYADAAQEPKWFTTAPAKALPKALEKANLKITDIDFFEINEAFSVVSLANMKLLHLPIEKVNIHGGAVALGHPLGCSGIRIIISLIHILKQNNARLGAAAICNGGGGASAIVIERP